MRVTTARSRELCVVRDVWPPHSARGSETTLFTEESECRLTHLATWGALCSAGRDHQKSQIEGLATWGCISQFAGHHWANVRPLAHRNIVGGLITRPVGCRICLCAMAVENSRFLIVAFSKGRFQKQQKFRATSKYVAQTVYHVQYNHFHKAPEMFVILLDNQVWEIITNAVQLYHTIIGSYLRNWI